MEKQLAAVGHTQREESIKWDLGKSETIKLRLLSWRSKSFCRRGDQKDFGELLEAFHRSPQRARGEKELGALIAILTKRGMCSDNKEQNVILGGKVDKRTIVRVG